IHEERSFSITPTNVTQVFTCYYTIINLNQDDNLGAVTQKNIPLIKATLCYGKLTASKHGHGRAWWLIISAYNESLYYTYLLTPHGIDTFPPQTNGAEFESDAGQAVFTPDGSKYIKKNCPNVNNTW